MNLFMAAVLGQQFSLYGFMHFCICSTRKYQNI